MPAEIDPEIRQALIEIVDERIRKLEVRRSDFTELKTSIERLEKSIEALVAAQARTDKSLETLTARTDTLAEAQARTDKSLEALVAAQARTDKSLETLTARTDNLAEAQARTDRSLEALAAAQAGTERALQNLAKQVGRLSDHVGFGLEDIARVVAPGYLLRHYGIEMKEFERRFLNTNGQQFEIDLYAEGRRNNRKIVVLGEVKSRIYSREVKQFARILERLKPGLRKETFRLIFGYWIHPSASIEAKKHDIELIASYQR